MRRLLPAVFMLVLAGCVPVPTPTVSNVTEPPDEAIGALAPGETIAVLDDGDPASRYSR